MFFLCRTKTRIAPVPVRAVMNFEDVKNHVAMGRHTDALIEPMETWRLARNMARKTNREIKAGTGTRAKNTPADVATPLPPRNERKTDQLCPAMAEKPAAEAR